MSSVRPRTRKVRSVESEHYILAHKRTDIIRVELIHAHANSQRRQAQCPGEQRAERRELAFMDVIHQDSVELNSFTPQRNTE